MPFLRNPHLFVEAVLKEKNVGRNVFPSKRSLRDSYPF